MFLVGAGHFKELQLVAIRACLDLGQVRVRHSLAGTRVLFEDGIGSHFKKQ